MCTCLAHHRNGASLSPSLPYSQRPSQAPLFPTPPCRYQLAAYYPFFRGHAHLEAKRREPWLFGEPHTSRIREAIRQRYRILPYLYTLFAAANGTGAPIMRPLWYEFPEEEGLFSEDQSFMLGGWVGGRVGGWVGGLEGGVALCGKRDWSCMAVFDSPSILRRLRDASCP